MKLLTRLIELTERAVAAAVEPVTLGAAFLLRRGRYSDWQRAQRRGAA